MARLAIGTYGDKAKKTPLEMALSSGVLDEGGGYLVSNRYHVVGKVDLISRVNH